MRVIPPLAITQLMLTSTTATEPGAGEANWASGTTYGLGDTAIIGAPSSTVTITLGIPAVFTWAAHGMADGTLVFLATTGALPTGLSAGVPYYVVNSTTDAFQLSATIGGKSALAVGSQSGTHTATAQVHRIYESLQDANIGSPPAVAASATWWQDAGPTNAWAMFDLLRNTATTEVSPLTVVLTPGQRINSVALMGLDADHVEVSATSVTGGGAVYSYSADLANRVVVDAYTYFFEPFGATPSVVLFDLPSYTDIVLTVTLTKASGYVSCGALVIGTFVYLGRMLHGAENDADNYSTVDRDPFGNAILIQRRTVPKMNGQVRFAKAYAGRLTDVRILLNATAAVWSGLDEQDNGYFGPLLILGFYKQFTLSLDQPEEGLLTLDVEEI